ncbi:MAG: sn-glycerol-3-phosphate ABC transporter ATP-binding protein UgpC [Planctomycetota bacterium]|nr:sn-glycerol-3-phosphate ABC transporter ATP-binding protein UgpC [Planctomycetota bacterium]
MAEVGLDNVCKVFPGGTVAVQGFTLDIRDQEFIVLVGPSGCGKSTTLRMVAGLEEITSGSVRIGSRVVNDVPPKDRDIAMVFQNYALYPHMTVYRNMAFGLKLRRFPSDEIDRRVHEAARILGIEDLLERKPKALSGGQRQRVAVGRAIVRQPQVFLFDEPLSNLDAKLRVEMRAELKRLHHRLRTTVIYVTHDQAEAMTLGDRVVVINDGRIQQVAPPLEIYDYPVNRFVAGFLGTPAMNFVPGRVVQRDGAVYFEVAASRVRLPRELGERVAGCFGRPATLGVRPEDLGYAAAGKFAGTENVLPAVVRVVEPLGSEQIVHLAGPGEVAMVCKLEAHVRVAVDQRMDVHLDMARIHVFDDQTGSNVTLEPEHVAHAS